MTILPFELADPMLSANQTFYPTGCVFAMMPTAEAAERCARDLGESAGLDEVQIATPAALTAALGQRAGEIAEHPPSAGREEQFSVRFLELAQQGEYGLLLRLAKGVDEERAKEALLAHDCSVAYHYRRLVIEEWVSPDRRARAAAADTL